MQYILCLMEMLMVTYYHLVWKPVWPSIELDLKHPYAFWLWIAVMYSKFSRIKFLFLQLSACIWDLLTALRLSRFKSQNHSSLSSIMLHITNSELLSQLILIDKLVSNCWCVFCLGLQTFYLGWMFLACLVGRCKTSKAL